MRRASGPAMWTRHSRYSPGATSRISATWTSAAPPRPLAKGRARADSRNMPAAVSGSVGATPQWTPALTIAWVSRQDADTGEAWLLSADSVFTASRRMAFDLSVQFGLNSEAPRLGVGGGLSFVLGELDPRKGSTPAVTGSGSGRATAALRGLHAISGRGASARPSPRTARSR